MSTVKETIERYKILSEDFLKKNIKIAIWDINGEFYFAYVLFVGDERLSIQCFAPEKKKGKSYHLYWATITRLEVYKEKEAKDGVKN